MTSAHQKQIDGTEQQFEPQLSTPWFNPNPAPEATQRQRVKPNNLSPHCSKLLSFSSFDGRGGNGGNREAIIKINTFCYGLVQDVLPQAWLLKISSPLEPEKFKTYHNSILPPIQKN